MMDLDEENVISDQEENEEEEQSLIPQNDSSVRYYDRVSDQYKNG